MPLRARWIGGGVLLVLATSACPVTDDYYLLTAGAANAGAGAHSGSPSAGGSSAMAGADTEPNAGSPIAGGMPNLAEAGAAGQAGESTTSCLPTTERCNGHDDDCDDVLDEFACVPNCSGFVLSADPGHGYMFCTAARKADWANARAACEAQDMRLAWLESEAENSAVAGKLDALGSDVEVMFGATDQGTEDEWGWYGAGARFWSGDEDGSPVNDAFNAWAYGQPNNNNNEDCGVMNPVTGAWTDRSCFVNFAYVCEEPN